ncbi:MAG: hypothetical protein R2813_07945 [Flavobacteriales bacterium]
MKEFPLIKKDNNSSVTKEQIQAAVTVMRNYFPQDENLKKISDDELIEKVQKFIASEQTFSAEPSEKVDALLGENLTDTCPYSIAVVVADCIIMLIGFCGLHTSNQQRVIKASAKEIGEEVSTNLPEWLELIAALQTADSMTDKAKAIFAICRKAYTAGMFKGIFASIKSSMEWYDWIIAGIAAVAQIAALFLTDGAAFIAEIALNGTAVAYVVSDSVKAANACSNSGQGQGGNKGQWSNGQWNEGCPVACTYTIGNTTYLYQQMNDAGNNYFVSTIAEDGTISPLKIGHWSQFLSVTCAYTVGGNHFLYLHNPENKYWFTAQLLSDGTIAPCKQGNWNEGCPVACTYTIGNTTYLYQQMNDAENAYFISTISEDGAVSPRKDGNWNQFLPVDCAFSIDNYTFLYTHNPTNREWFILNLNQIYQ